jgi:hypothetical protein
VESSLLPGILRFAALMVAPVVVLLLVRHGDGALRRLRSALIRVHCWPREPVVPEGPPLEELAASLRRLYPCAHHPPAGMRMPKQRGVLMAYDARLVVAARALGVPTVLADLPLDTFEHECERLRLERALTAAGLVWQAALPPDRAA